MAGEIYIDRAVSALAAYLRTNLPAALRTREAALGLVPGSLADPDEVIEAAVSRDVRSLLVQVFDVRWSFQDQRNRVLEVECNVAVSYSGDADVAAGQLFVRRYMSAILTCLQNAPTLGGAVAELRLLDGDREFVAFDQSTTRHVAAQGAVITLQEAA